jgi:hypothetical protein
MREVTMHNTKETIRLPQFWLIQFSWLSKFLKTLLIIQLGAAMTACADSNTKSWQEEVKLLDGRIIIVTIKYGFPRGVFRESWVTLKLPETGNEETTWHEHLQPQNLNVVNGKLYIVGTTGTTVEFRLYNFPRPPYVGFVYDNKVWNRIPFNEIPEAMYDMNLSSYGVEPKNPRMATLAEKNKILMDPRRAKEFVRIDPLYKYPGDEFYRNCTDCK